MVKDYTTHSFRSLFPDHPDDQPTRDKCPLCGSTSLEYKHKPTFGKGGLRGVLEDSSRVYCKNCQGRIRTEGLDRRLVIDTSEEHMKYNNMDESGTENWV